VARPSEAGPDRFPGLLKDTDFRRPSMGQMHSVHAPDEINCAFALRLQSFSEKDHARSNSPVREAIERSRIAR
jgi:hypothetical protein